MLNLFLQYVWQVSLVGVAILVVAYWGFCAGKIWSIRSQIKRVLAAEDIVAALKESDSLAPLWKNFSDTLTRTPDAAYSTTDAAEFFSPQILTRGMNMTFWQSYGGIFTGLGILGTFAGLTFGLQGVDMTSGDIEVLKDGIKNLLSGVESAFVTSLVGIGGAIVYSVVHHWLMANFHGNIKRLTDKLDEKFPRRSAEDWLAKNFTETQNQTMTLQKIFVAIDNLSTSGASAVGDIFADKVGDKPTYFPPRLKNFRTSSTKNFRMPKIFPSL